MKGERFGHVYLKRLFLAFYILLAANIPLSVYAWYEGVWPGAGRVGGLPRSAALIVTPGIFWVIWMTYQVLPKKKDAFASWRTTTMGEGKNLYYTTLYGFYARSVISSRLYPEFIDRLGNSRVLWTNSIYAVVMSFVLLWDGILRMFLTFKRLRLRTGILMLSAIWIPAVNLLVLPHAMKLIHEKYNFRCHKESIRRVGAGSDLYSMEYPFLLTHGVGFRDLRYFNY